MFMVRPGSPVPENPEKLTHVCYYSVYSGQERSRWGVQAPLPRQHCQISGVDSESPATPRVGHPLFHQGRPRVLESSRAVASLRRRSRLCLVCVMGKGAQGPKKVKVDSDY